MAIEEGDLYLAKPEVRGTSFSLVSSEEPLHLVAFYNIKLVAEDLF
jgi:hypothetical protein